MSYNVKNYTEQGGEKTVIGGTLEIKEGATVTGLPIATTSAVGCVKQAENVSDSEATTVAQLVTAFNALLAKLRTAGILETPAVDEE